MSKRILVVEDQPDNRQTCVRRLVWGGQWGGRYERPGRCAHHRVVAAWAVWQAERVVSDHNRNTLRMRVEAEGDLAKFEPGMLASSKKE